MNFRKVFAFVFFVFLFNSDLIAQFDLIPASSIAPATGCNLTNSETISLTISNSGSANYSGPIEISYKINGAAAITETITTTILAGGNYTHTFASTTDLTSCINYSFKFYVTALGDINYSNDTLIKNIGSHCDNYEIICPSTVDSLAAAVGGFSAPVGNNYDCLVSTFNPKWYVFETDGAGTMSFQLAANSDIDFIVYGPYASMTQISAACGNHGNGANPPVVACSFSASNIENFTVNSGGAGELYVLMVNNWSGVVGNNYLFTQTAGTTILNCACEAEAGTTTTLLNGTSTSSPVLLCGGDQLTLWTNYDYVLPSYVIPQPQGDGILTSDLIWLLYDAVPTNSDPSLDPGYTGIYFDWEDVYETNNASSVVISNFGCGGTYWFVPITADDGEGANNNVANGVDDNGLVQWDALGTGCYDMGDPVQVTYFCPINYTTAINCTPPVINGVDISISGGNPPYVISSTGSGTLSTGTLTGPGVVTVSNLQNGWNYQITITDANGCSILIDEIFVKDDPTFILDNFCYNNESPFPSISGTAGGYFQFNILPTDGSTINSSNGQFFPNNIGTYEIEYITVGICPDSLTIPVEVFPIPVKPEIIATDSVFCGSGPITSLIINPSGIEANWYLNQLYLNLVATSQNYTPSGLNAGTNWIYATVENSFSCESDADSIPYIFNTNILANAGEDFVLCAGSIAELNASGGITYLWSPAADVSDATIPNPTIQPFASTFYSVVITDILGCEIIDSVFVEILEGDDCPHTYSAFSPNNDGVNDTWIIDGIEGVFNNQVTIYNRWGDVIQRFDNYDNLSVVWAGNDSNNNDMPAGTYFFTIQSNGESVRSGWVQVVK